MKVVPAVREEEPEGGRKLRRVASGRWSNPPLSATDSRAEQSPGDGHCTLAPLGQTEGRGPVRTTGGQGRATSPYGFSRGEHPGERTLDVAAG